VETVKGRAKVLLPEKSMRKIGEGEVGGKIDEKRPTQRGGKKGPVILKGEKERCCSEYQRGDEHAQNQSKTIGDEGRGTKIRKEQTIVCWQKRALGEESRKND